MVAWRSRGDVLRWWRHEIRGLTQQQAADRLCVQASALSNWERGTRAIPIDLQQVDEALKGDDVLAGLLWAYGTSEGLDAAHIWSKVYPGPSQPVWMWIRSESAELKLEGEWGVARIETVLRPGPNGIFLTSGASVHDSPVVIHLSEPGWADFGTGEIPSEMPGAPVVSAVTMFQPSTADGTFMDLFKGNMAGKISSRSRDVAYLVRLAPRSVGRFFAALTRSKEPKRHAPWPPRPEGIDAVERMRFGRLRRARGLSLMDVAERLGQETSIEVGRDTLRRFETGIGHPHDRLLPVALDRVLGADGRLAILDVRSHRGTGIATFPPYWRGPVWIDIECPPVESMLILQRGNWRRELRVRGSTLVSLHWFDPAVPLRIGAEPTVSWTVGVGRRSGAEPIDQNWVPITVDVAHDAISQIESALITALERAGNEDDDEPGDRIEDDEPGDRNEDDEPDDR